jgi:hypothetical protein
MSEEMAVVSHVTAGGAMTLKSVVDRVNVVHQVMDKVMQKGTHYGSVPGCGSRMVLLKPGADVLAMTFRLSPEYRITRHEMQDGHREYEVTCIMRGADGTVIGEGVGSASTMEKKYRYRNGEENPDIADVYNTVLKIAKKRAHIDATLTCTGASDMFTQDLIDEDESKPARKKVEPPKPIDGNEVFGTIEDVKVKDGGTADKPWRKFGVVIGGEAYGTFDRAMGEAAQGAIGKACQATYKDDGKYKTLLTLDIGNHDADELPL